MVMPMNCSNESMFPPSSYDYKQTEASCNFKYGVEPRPHWITTEYGGHVSIFYIYIYALVKNMKLTICPFLFFQKI